MATADGHTPQLIDHGDLGPDHPASIADGCRHCIRIAALNRALREFGYASLTMAESRDAYHIAMQRKPDASDGIIATLTRSQLEQAGIVREEA
jgi:hypothetical protein